MTTPRDLSVRKSEVRLRVPSARRPSLRSAGRLKRGPLALNGAVV